MRLATLFPDVPDVPAVCVAGIAIDSRQVRRGDLFVALQGARYDGHDHVAAAIAAGAAAVASERPLIDCAVPQVSVVDLARRVSSIAGALFNEPSRALQIVAVTGTNGKTSVAHYAATLAQALGVQAGFLGTTGWGLVGGAQELDVAELTTADAVTLQQRLHLLRQAGAQLVALELSSHALAQYRADGLAVDVGVFTNLTRDHLDYHRTMAAYGAAKARLFEFPGLQHAVLNVDDAYGAELYQRYRPLLPSSAVGSTATAAVGQFRLGAVRATAQGLTWQLRYNQQQYDVAASVYGAYNAGNISVAVAALVALGYPLAALLAAVPQLQPPRGRLQRLPGGADAPAVFVDYAHTPDALRTVLAALRGHVTGKLICVFGCGGDRDAGKRAPMGRAVAMAADVAWLTTDNPRTEDPGAIIRDVEQGWPTDALAALHVAPERGVAIAHAVQQAQAGDVVLIAGKGHETYQEINGVRAPFDDLAVAAAALAGTPSSGERR